MTLRACLLTALLALFGPAGLAEAQPEPARGLAQNLDPDTKPTGSIAAARQAREEGRCDDAVAAFQQLLGSAEHQAEAVDAIWAIRLAQAQQALEGNDEDWWAEDEEETTSALDLLQTIEPLIGKHLTPTRQLYLQELIAEYTAELADADEDW